MIHVRNIHFITFNKSRIISRIKFFSTARSLFGLLVFHGARIEWRSSGYRAGIERVTRGNKYKLWNVASILFSRALRQALKRGRPVNALTPYVGGCRAGATFLKMYVALLSSVIRNGDGDGVDGRRDTTIPRAQSSGTKRAGRRRMRRDRSRTLRRVSMRSRYTRICRAARRNHWRVMLPTYI